MAGLKPVKHTGAVVIHKNSNADMTSNQYGWVQLFASNTCGTLTGTANTTGTYIIGIQENFPNSGSNQDIRICVAGPTLARAGEAIAAGAYLTYQTNSGWVFAATGTVGTGTRNIVGRALESASAANVVFEIFVNDLGIIK
jgi:hypothetical protein